VAQPFLGEAEAQGRLRQALEQSPLVQAVFDVAAALDLPDWLLVSGAVYQTLWNTLTGQDVGYGVRDFDLVYFDPDLSYAAEDRIIRAAYDAAPEALRSRIEVRNQARVHLWFEHKFGEPYAPLRSTAEALTRFVCPAFAVGAARRGATLELAAPFGLEDCRRMRLRLNPLRPSPQALARAAASVKARWPEVEVDEI
jgi:hypothetical protein